VVAAEEFFEQPPPAEAPADEASQGKGAENVG